MSVPPRLASKLNDTLGAAAAGDLVTWLDDMRAQHIELRADLAEVHQEARAMELRLTTRMETLAQASDIAEIKAQLGDLAKASDVTELATALRAEIHVVDNKIERRFSDLILWSFVFWVGAVSAIALLAGVLKP